MSGPEFLVPTTDFTFSTERDLSDVDELAFPQSSRFYGRDNGSFDSESYITSSTSDVAVEQNGAIYSPQSSRKVYLNPPYIHDSDINWSNTNKTLGAKFSPNSVNGLVCYVFGKEPKEKNEEVEDEILQDQIYTCPLSRTIDDRRSFYNDSYLKFMEAARVDRKDIIRTIKLCNIYLDYSRLIKNRTKKLNEKLNDKLNMTKFQDEKTHLELSTFQDISAVWELCRIIYIPSKQEYNQFGQLSLELIKWINHCFPLHPLTEDEEEHLEQLQQNQELHQDDFFWSRLCGLVIRGLPEAKMFLKSIDKNDGSEFSDYVKLVLDILDTRPRVTELEYHEFNLRRHEWLSKISDLQTKLRGKSFLEGRINDILMILRGHTKTIIEKSSTWQEALGGLVYHVRPTCDAQELKNILNVILEKIDTCNTALDDALIEFIFRRVEKGIQHCERIDLWLSAHLSDILNKLDLVGRIHSQSSHQKQSNIIAQPDVDIREHYLLSYAESMVFHTTLWQLAFKYFEHCETCGYSYMSQLVVRIPFEDEFKASKLLSICKENGLTFQEKTISRIMGKKYWQNERYASAIVYFINAGDTASLEVIYRRFLDNYIDTGKLTFLDTIESIQLDEDSPVSIKFLSRYRLFHALKQNGEVQRAGAILMELLKAQVAPISFWPVLLLNALPLLQEGKARKMIIFSTQDTLEILRNLQDVTSFVYQEEFLACIERLKKWHTQENGYPELDNNLTALRLALLQNSADCYIENSSSPWMFE
ncbi:nuclear pore complex protein Nup85 [Gigaspora margarita]|uniref:Nuclear pore complex protein Nup85 n=1 Tax=Gigaspora margarita TaxID=4874 RepID=A0A8H3ZYY9_GIGMA|nr:nuclear pore complex protein Nup85 [Gigaspora margarita]